LPGTPAFTDESGHAVPALQIVFHELTLTRKDANGTTHFLLDGKWPIKTRASNLVRSDALRPSLTTNELVALRRRYLGHAIWTFGSWTMARECLHPRISAGVDLRPGQRITVARIYQLERAPVECANWGTNHNNLAIDFGIDESMLKAWKGGVFLFVYSRLPIANSGLSLSADARVSEASKVPESRYSEAYNLFVGDWFLDQLFSFTPPPPGIRKGIRRFLATLDSGHPYLAKSHIEAAWIYGWPMEHEPLAKILQEPRWSDNRTYSVVFKGDRVASYYNGP